MPYHSGMFNNISKTGAGLYVTLIEAILHVAGVDFPDGSVADAVNGVVAVIGLALLIIGQFSRKDLKVGLVRKEPKTV